MKIYGGKVTANGSDGAAGIGGGYHDTKGGSCGVVEIYGGEVIVMGGSSAAGIGYYYEAAFGFPGCVPVQADYNGDDAIDLGVWAPATGIWYMWLSDELGGHYYEAAFGYAGCDSASADYDGDGIADMSVRDPVTKMWYVYGSKDGFWSFGL